MVKESVPDPFADGSEEHPLGLLPIHTFSEAQVRRMLRHYWKESKRARRPDHKRAINGWINILLGYLRLLEKRAGVEKLTSLERRERESKLVIELVENEIEEKVQTIKVLQTILINYQEVLEEAKDEQRIRGYSLDEIVALRTLHKVPKKDCPEEKVRKILKRFGLPENRVIKMASGYRLKQ